MLGIPEHFCFIFNKNLVKEIFRHENLLTADVPLCTRKEKNGSPPNYFSSLILPLATTL